LEEDQYQDGDGLDLDGFILEQTYEEFSRLHVYNEDQKGAGHMCPAPFYALYIVHLS
jgi:hypothetical protein